MVAGIVNRQQRRRIASNLFFIALSRPISSPQQSDACCNGDAAVNRPPSLSGHETAREHIDPLQEPDGTH
jgi:hypothetical protein